MIWAVLGGCAGDPILRMPGKPPENIRAYKHLRLHGHQEWVNTGITLAEGDFFTILAEGRVRLTHRYMIGPSENQFYLRIGSENYFTVFGTNINARTRRAGNSGPLYLGIHDYYFKDNTGFFDVDVIVWKREDYSQIAAFFEQMSRENPGKASIRDAFNEAERFRRIEVARRETTQAIDATKKEIDRMKTAVGDAYAQGIARLESKLGALIGKLKELDDIEAHLKAEQQRADQLGRELARVSQEKEALTAKLQSEADVKQQLQSTLKARETAYESQEALVVSLYEQERQLRSKLDQLGRAEDQSREKQAELTDLEARVEELNRRLQEVGAAGEAAPLKGELERMQYEKTRLEKEAADLKSRQDRLKGEVERLQGQAESARVEKERSEKELEAMRSREAALLDEVSDLRQRLQRGMAPVVVVTHPDKDAVVTTSSARLQFTAVDDRGIDTVSVLVNDQPLAVSGGRGLKVEGADGGERPKRVSVSEKLPLEIGNNRILIRVTDSDGAQREEVLEITRENERGTIWAVVVGINRYQHARQLKYAVNDAVAFRDYLRDTIGVPGDHLFFLADEEATRERVQSLMGTVLKRRAGPEDTVIIFYAGHGAVETDPSNPDGDGFEKYLLPCDADLADLYTSAISMNEVRTIFQRIQADRLIFIADTCYSGASGGRTTLVTKTRANLSERFLERIARGRGRVIITSCSANEVSKEDDGLGHGIFSYYLMEGLKGGADRDEDGIITVDELFSYISRKVPEASNQDQHPVKKGEVEGELVIGYVK